MILSRTARSAAAYSASKTRVNALMGGLRSLTRSSTRTECCPSDQGRFLGRLTWTGSVLAGVQVFPIAYDAPASDMHFLVKLVCAAPCRFCALAWSAQHFLAKLFKAAPCRLLPVACTAQLSSAAAAVTMKNDATMMASVFMFFSLVVARKILHAGDVTPAAAACRSGALCRRSAADTAPAT